MASTGVRDIPARLFLGLAIASAACDDSTGPTPTPPGPASGDTAAVLIHSQAPGARIPADVMGLGFETPVLRDVRFTGDPAFERLLANLGPGVLRFGGNSVESATWSPTPVTDPPGTLVLTPSDVDRVFAFAARIGWRVIIDLRLGHFEPDTAAAEAAMLQSRGGTTLLAVEIGNEPDVYLRNGLRGLTWNPDQLRQEFGTYATRIHARAPSVPIAGPATTCEDGGPAFFAATVGGVSDLALATHHFYPMAVSAPPSSPEFASIENMLSPALMARTAQCLAAVAPVARGRGLPLRLAETNSASGFGKRGVSDVLASALWGVDHFFTALEQGAVGVNVETGTDLQGGLTCAGVYLPFCGGDGSPYTARPLYYAMLLVHAAARGRVLPVETRSGFNVVAHATLDDDGTLRVALVNKERARAIQVRLDAGRANRSAGVQRLVGPALDRQDGVTFAGATVSGDGSWAPGPEEPVPVQGTGVMLTLPPASAALLSIR